MKMYYAERLGKKNEPYIAERGIFLSVEEFVPYRKKGWSGTEELDNAADIIIKAEKMNNQITCDRCGKLIDQNTNWGNRITCGDDLCQDCFSGFDDVGNCKRCEKDIKREYRPREYKPRKPRTRYFFVQNNSYPERCVKADYEYWKKDFSNIKTFNKKTHINGWKEAVYNHFGALVGYAV